MQTLIDVNFRDEGDNSDIKQYHDAEYTSLSDVVEEFVLQAKTILDNRDPIGYTMRGLLQQLVAVVVILICYMRYDEIYASYSGTYNVCVSLYDRDGHNVANYTLYS